MRISAIEIENFKGISERVRVDLKPITLLFGANSAGKSTILHALLYMKDVLDRRNLDAISTPVSGRALDLGGFRNFVHGQDLNRTIRIRVHMEVTGAELPSMAPRYELPSILSEEAGKRIDHFEGEHAAVLEWVRSATVGIEVRWDETAKFPVAFAYTVGMNNDGLVRIERGTKRLKIREDISLEDEEDEEQTPGQEEGRSADLGKKQCPDLFKTLVEGLAGVEEWLPASQDPIPDFSPKETLKLLEADWAEEEEEATLLGEYRRFSCDAIEVVKMRAWERTSLVASLFIGPGKLLQDWLRGLRYIGPLRARPPRKGIPAVELSDWSEGLAAWKALEDEDTSPKLIDEVSEWLAGKDRLNSGYKLERRHLAQVNADAFRNAVEGDLDRAQLLDLLKEAPKSTEIKLVETRSGLRLDPSDVGVGISQVLPIVVGAVVPSGSVVAIEQPELHIHPAMQVALGDLFIEGAKKRDMAFLIETHSEHLMLRLLRRIRETSDSELPPALPEVKPEDIGVLYVDNGDGGMRITSLPIDNSGEFTERWPRGFFVERGTELF